MNPIKQARILAGHSSATHAARAVGLDQSWYCKIERGEHAPGAKLLTQLAGAFNATAGQLLGLEPLPEIQDPDLAAG